MSAKRIPSKLAPDFIVSSVVELRFTPMTSDTTIFASLFASLKDTYPVFKPPAYQGPVTNQMFAQIVLQPDGYLSNDFYVVGIGQNVLSLSMNAGKSYSGWAAFSGELRSVFEKIFSKTKLIFKFDRLGLRYINFFAGTERLDRNIDFNIQFANRKDYTAKQTAYRTLLEKGETSINLFISDGSQINNQGPIGTAIDIDVFSMTTFESGDVTKIMDRINILHDEEKALFFGLVSESFLASHNPEYK
jgi:uncharacterized protein (TIGR04255 family)